MTFPLHRGGCIAAVALLVSAGAASAQVPWSNPAGAGSFFTWSNGESGLGIFGSPGLVGGNTFVFNPPAFVATSANGVAGSISDQVKVRLTANPGERFTQIRITELGTWSIAGIGSVQDSGTLFLTDLINVRPPAVNNLTTNPVMPISTPGNGGWNGSVLIDLAALGGPNWTSLQLIFTNSLQANTGAGTPNAANIAKTRMTIEIIPAPGSLALLGLGGLAAIRRRRR